jgi:hypothetical protein
MGGKGVHLVERNAKMGIVEGNLKEHVVQPCQLPALCLGSALGATGVIDTLPQSINQHKLPYAIKHCGTWLPDLEARMVAAALDAAARTTSPEEGGKAWGIVQLSGPGHYIKTATQLRSNKHRPLVGWPDEARILYGVYDWEYYEVARLEVRMRQQPKRPYMQIVGYRGSFAKFVGSALGLMLNRGIAPDRGDDAILERFYGVGGIVDETNEKHRAAASAALRRNPDIHSFFRKSLTAAML